MIDWRRGGPTGSIRRWVARELHEHFATSPVLRRTRYGWPERVLRAFFSIATFGKFILFYVIFNVIVIGAEAVLAAYLPSWLPAWTAGSDEIDIRSTLMNVASYLITAQVGVLGVVSLALALVTLIAQRENASSDVKLYYHESLAFEVVASCIALLAVLCAQLLWPGQFLLHSMGLGTHLFAFKILLLSVHVAWILVNLAGLAHFVSTTFAFVQQKARIRLRERYTANFIVPREISKRLREQLYASAGRELAPNGGVEISFGLDYGAPAEVELSSTFDSQAAMIDVRMRLVSWAVKRWERRCLRASSKLPNPQTKVHATPLLWFAVEFDVSLRGRQDWCKRRGGVPLDRLEHFVLRRAFRFRRINDGR